MHSQGQDERATQHAVNKATPSIANLVHHFGGIFVIRGMYLTHNWECNIESQVRFAYKLTAMGHVPNENSI